MPSIADSAVIFILALMLFGPKKLPQLARQLGKLMAEFRRASNEFRMQMEDELRIEDQKEHQKKVDAMAGPPSTLPDPEHPHLPSSTSYDESAEAGTEIDNASLHDGTQPMEAVAAVEPIAQSGELKMMPPSTGLPVESGTFGRSAKDNGSAYTNGNGHHEIPEHSILPEPPVGISSEEPAAETTPAEEQTHA